MRWQDLQELLDSRRRKSDTGATIAVLFAGMSAGLVTGLLLAPRSGRETRALLQQKARSSMDNGKDAVDTAKQTIDQVADTTKQVAQDTKQDIRKGTETDQPDSRKR